MEDDEKRKAEDAGAGRDRDPIRLGEQVDKLVLDIARLIGRQLAREEFARRLAAVANDNEPLSSEEDEDGADKD